MGKKVTLAFSLSCLLVLAASLWACSPAPIVPIAPTPAPRSTELSPTWTPEAAGQEEWSQVQAAGVLRVGCPLDNPPFNMYNADFQPDGFDVALMTEIARQLGLKVEFNDFAFDGLLGALQLGRVDAAIAALAITDERRAVADFTSAYYQGEDVILAAANSALTSIASRQDLAQRRVGVQRGTVYESWLQRNMVQTGEMPAANLLAYSRPADALTALAARRIDLVIMDREPGLQQVAQGTAKAVGKSLYVQDFAIATRKGSTLTPYLNRALARVLADGTVARLAEKYLQLPPDHYTPVPPPPTEEPQPTAEPTAAAPTVSPTAAPSPTPVLIDDMAWEGDLSYDDAAGVPVVQPGQAIEKGWRIRNSGTTTWGADYRFVYANGNTPVSNMGGAPLVIGQSVPPGEMIDVYVDLVAPQAPGTYQGFWQMKSAAGRAFGEKVWVKVRVPAPPTAVPPPTAIPAPGISFTADRYQITAGESTWINWNVTGVQAVWFCTPPGPTCRGVTGQGREQVWPSATTTYVLRLQHTDGRPQDVPLTIAVNPAPNAPTIVDFNLDRSTIRAGEGLNLWWKVQGNATRIALVRNGHPLRDYALAEEGYLDQPPGAGQVIYELQVWGPGSGEPAARRQRAVTIEAAPAPPATIDVYGCGNAQALRAGDTLKIHLEAAGGTGYEWDLKEVDPSVLAPMGITRDAVGGLGGAVLHTFTYLAQRGSTTVVLILYRPSEGPQSATETCYIPVSVQ